MGRLVHPWKKPVEPQVGGERKPQVPPRQKPRDKPKDAS